MQELLDSRGGVIAIDKDGNFGKSFTSNMMALAYIKDEEIEFGLELDRLQKESV